jgi:Ca2+-binding EF-hand superfamily protein
LSSTRYTIFFHRLAQVLDSADANGDGRLDLPEFVSLCRAIGQDATQDTLDAAFHALDSDSGGFVSFRELCSWAARQYVQATRGVTDVAGLADPGYR